MNIDKIKNSKTKYIGKEIEYYDEINSTHIYAKNIAMKEKNSGKLIIAEIQSNGIGTKGRIWHTGENKNIAMTIIFKNNCKISKINNLTIDVAKIMQKTLKKLYNVDLTIKEPNDLLLNGKKICGILTEVATTGEMIKYLIISLGMNVNEEIFTDDIRNTATSLKIEYGKEFSRENIIIEFIENLENYIDKIF